MATKKTYLLTGYKFLAPDAATYHDGRYCEPFGYTIPTQYELVASPTVHPNPEWHSRADCGPGRLHIMNDFNAVYAPPYWWPWAVSFEAKDVVGRSKEKTSVRALRLRRITIPEFEVLMTNGTVPKGVYKHALLDELRLVGAVWSRICLTHASMRSTNLVDANITRSTFHRVAATDADFERAIITRSDFSYSDLASADFSRTTLARVDFTLACMRDARFEKASLTAVDFDQTDLRGANFSGATFTRVKFHHAILDGAYFQSVVLSKQVEKEIKAAGYKIDDSYVAQRI